MFKWMKYLGVLLGSFICAIYFIFLVSEGDSKVLAFLFGLPFLAWPIVTWKWTNIGALAMLITGVVTSWLYLMGSLFYDIGVGATGFLLLALLPSIIISGMLLYYWYLEGV